MKTQHKIIFICLSIGLVTWAIGIILSVTILHAAFRTTSDFLIHILIFIVALGIALLAGSVISKFMTRYPKAEKALMKKGNGLRALMDAPSEGIFLHEGGKIIAAHGNVARLLGYESSEMVGKSVTEVIAPESLDLVIRNIRAAHDLPFEAVALKKDNSTIVVELHGRDTTYEGRRVRATSVRDITARKQWGESPENISVNSPVGMYIVQDKKFQFVNLQFCKDTGYTEQELLSMDPLQIVHPEDRKMVRENSIRMLKKEFSEPYEFRTISKDGHIHWPIESVTSIQYRDKRATLGFYMDITERKLEEKQRELYSRILQLLNKSGEKEKLIRDLLELIKEHGQFEAVGIRLRDGNDFPYYETSGFPTEHIRSENSLCTVNDKGEPLCDSQGNPVLECMCGNIICGRFDSAKPFFTKGGSFWTNSTTDLLAFTTEADRPGLTRNRCNREGYESVALIPLKTGNITLGLLQINDTRRNCFTSQLIGYYESLAQSIGIALAGKYIEEALQTSETKYRDLYKNAPVAYFSVGLDGLIKESNKAAQLLFGYSEEELIGKSRLELYAPECVAKAGTVFEKLKKGSSLEDEEMTYQKKDGGKVYGLLSTTPILDNKGHLVAVRSVVKDITVRKLAEETLRESEERYRSLMELSATVGQAIIVFRDIEEEIGKQTYFNQEWPRLTGYSEQELFRMSFFDLLDFNDRQVISIEQQGKTRGQLIPGLFEISIIRKDGTRLPVEITSVYTLHEGRNANVAFIRDITQRKKIEEQLVMSDRLASLGKLVAGVAHELNNPLTSVIGFSQLLKERDLPDDIKGDLDLICSEAQRAAVIVKNLLTFARTRVSTKQPTKINDVIEEVMQLRAYSQKLDNIEVNRQFASDLPEIMTDYFQMRQVFLNLTLNAEYFMIEAHHGGSLTITTEKVNNTIKISFADDGPGITRENMSQLFIPFFTTKEVGKGTGLGLSICHGIVIEHGGKIYAESELGKGATFVLELPINDH